MLINQIWSLLLICVLNSIMYAINMYPYYLWKYFYPTIKPSFYSFNKLLNSTHQCLRFWLISSDIVLCFCNFCWVLVCKCRVQKRIRKFLFLNNSTRIILLPKTRNFLCDSLDHIHASSLTTCYISFMNNYLVKVSHPFCYIVFSWKTVSFSKVL